MSVTYLIGAGASYNCLPVVKDIPQRYSRFVKKFKKLVLQRNGEVIKEFFDDSTEEAIYWESKLYNYLKSFEDGIHKHYSVDTYAKKMFLTKDKNLRFYKLCLSIFFTYEQIRQGLDQRYDTFFASILKESVKDLPDNLNIVSWNYDMQFEIAYANFSGAAMIEDSKQVLRINTKNEILDESDTKNRFHIIKLNGSTEVYNPENEVEPFYLKSRFYNKRRDLASEDVDQLGEVLRFFESLDGTDSTLSFAWEDALGKVDTVTKRAIASTEKTETLVVVGYSFPYFNRLVDRNIFDRMSKLKKIYIQDPGADLLVEKVRELCIRVAERKVPDIVPIRDVAQFLIPNELD